MSPGGEFDLPTSAEAKPDGTWTASFDTQPIGFGGTHGGYLSALGLRTMAALVTDVERTPRSLTTHLLASVLAWFGKPRPSVGYVGVDMPGVPPPGECKALIEKPVPEAGVRLLVEHRPARSPLPLTGGDRAEIVASTPKER